MKKVLYIYLPNTVAEMEIGYIMQANYMQKFLGEPKYEVKSVGQTREPILTLGGMTMVPDCTIQEIEEDRIAGLLLPGANTWDEEAQRPVLQLAKTYIERGILVGAICGATLALADMGVFDKRSHTSNAVEYLCAFSSNYKGAEFYKNEVSVVDDNLITAGTPGALLWAKNIMEYLKMYEPDKIEAWYNYFATGKVEYYMQFMPAMQ